MEDMTQQPYGDLTEINTNRLILDSVGKDVLNNIVSDYLDLLGSSSAIYEKNGGYVYSIFSSDWCKRLDVASRELCDTYNNKAALSCGKWLCHESGWTNAAKIAIETGKPVDIECNGGLRLYAIPIRASGEIIGAINFGYGEPPKDSLKLMEIARKYNIGIDELDRLSLSHKPLSGKLLENSKKRLITTAMLIGKFAEHKQAEGKIRLNVFRSSSLLALNEMHDSSDKAISDFILERSVNMTNSSIGFFGFISEDESKMIIHSWSRSAMAECAVQDKPIHYPIEKAGLWGEAVRQRKPIIVNNYTASNPLKRGLPKGHVQLKRLLAIPVLDNEHIVGVLAAGNKEEPYDETDVNQLKLLVEGMWRITQRRRAEALLKQSEERFRNMAQNIQSGLSIVEDGRMVYCNDKLCEILGYPKEEIFKMNWNDFVVSTEKDQLEEIWQNFLTTKQPADSFCWIVRKDGSKRYIHNRYSAHGEEDSFYCVTIDLTEQKTMEGMLTQAQKMEAIGTLAGGIAHDFNNILSSIMGFTDMAMLEIPEGSNAKENMKEVHQASMRARDLVRQIFAFSQKNIKEKKLIEPHFIIKEAIKFLRATIPTTITIKQKIDAEPGTIMADPTQIHQVLMNLSTNAVHAMQEKGGILEIGLITVNLKEEDIKNHSGLAPGKFMRLTVSDTGHGIAPEIADRIFDPFFTTKERDRGTGMGLSVVHGIVHNHGGTIIVESKPGKGTKFLIFLPKTDEETGKKEAAELQVPTGSETILFVDDEEMLVKSGKMIFESLGYTVVAEKSSTEVLEVFRKEPGRFDIVITDQTMPHMTGYELAKMILKIRPGIPIILCTGYNETVTEEKAKKSGIKAFVMKPINRNEIAEVVRRVLDQKVN